MTALEFWHRLRHRLWFTREILLMVRPANTPIPDLSGKNWQGELRRATMDTLSDCGDFEDAAHYVPIYRRMLERGDLINFGYLNGKCVYRHAEQLSGDIIWEGTVVRHLGEKEMYGGYSFCTPSARGNGWQKRSICNMLSDHPDYTIYSLILPSNKVSLHSNCSIGYRPCSLLTVKNRFFRHFITEKVLTPEEVSSYLSEETRQKEH